MWPFHRTCIYHEIKTSLSPFLSLSLSLCSYFVCCIYSQLTVVRVGRCLTGRRTVPTSLTGTQSTPVWTTPSLNSAASTITERDTICLPLSSTQVKDLTRNKLSLFLFWLDCLRMQLDWLLTYRFSTELVVSVTCFLQAQVHDI